MTDKAAAPGDRPPRLWDIFLTALRLGVTSFGGPIAHLGYFERTYVERKRWLSHEAYAQLVALCQVLPGPASSQVNFLIGWNRAGPLGAIVSWAGFTLPSALIMYLFAVLTPAFHGPVLDSVLHGLKLAAVAIVAQAVWTMAVKLCPDRQRAAIALAALVIMLLSGGTLAQVGVTLIGLLAGVLLCRNTISGKDHPTARIGKVTATCALIVFFALLAGLPILALNHTRGPIQFADISYRSGALVFGGGHVVMPLLRSGMVPTSFVSDGRFLDGYGAVQAVPGPLFTLASYLGAAAAPPGQAPFWAVTGLVAIFLPGLLLVVAGAPIWRWIGHHAWARGGLAGINAAVVGILAAAFYDPVFKTAVTTTADMALAAIGFVLLQRWKTPPIVIVLLCIAGAETLRLRL